MIPNSRCWVVIQEISKAEARFKASGDDDSDRRGDVSRNVRYTESTANQFHLSV
jgi:hypothetical protein